MGQSRTLGAVRSYFSKNRKRLDFDRVADEAQARIGGANGIPMQQVCLHGLACLCPMPVVPGSDTALERARISVLLVHLPHPLCTVPVAIACRRQAAGGRPHKEASQQSSSCSQKHFLRPLAQASLLGFQASAAAPLLDPLASSDRSIPTSLSSCAGFWLPGHTPGHINMSWKHLSGTHPDMAACERGQGLQTCGAWLQGPLAGDGPEAADMLSTLQAMSAHSSHVSTLPSVLNTSMQPPFSQQVKPLA